MDRNIILKKVANSFIERKIDSLLPSLEHLPPEKLKRALSSLVTTYKADPKEVYKLVSDKLTARKKLMVKQFDILEDISS